MKNKIEITTNAEGIIIVGIANDSYPASFGPYRPSTAEVIAADHGDFFLAACRFPGGIGSPSFRDMIDRLAADMGGYPEWWQA